MEKKIRSQINEPEIFKISYGGWYQRTTLHLSEVYDFLASAESKLSLPKEKLKYFQEKLDLEKVTRETGYLEFVKAKTKGGIEIRYYEDGLYILEINSEEILKSQGLLEDYFNNIFSPAISYIFSLGAPTPKVLANIKTVHPTVISLTKKQHANFQVDTRAFGPVYNEITSKNITVYKTPSYIFVAASPDSKLSSIYLVESLIFFREFKDQLEKYLNIHRIIWEEISVAFFV